MLLGLLWQNFWGQGEGRAIIPPRQSMERAGAGRNELIARYIKLRTGKTRTRKQVSSHIQVLARRKAREIQAKLKFWQGALPGQAGPSQDVKPFSQQPYAVQPPLPLPVFESPAGLSPSPSAPPWQGRRVASSKLWMLEFSAFLEQQQDQDTYNKHLFVHIGQSSPSYNDPYLEAVDIRQIYDKFPEKKGGLKELFERGPANAFFLVKFWADLNTNIEDESRSFYGVSSQYESPENMIITCSTKVCSFGKQVVEKVETEYARYENGHYSYRIHRSPLCEYMINFIHKLKHLPEKYMMNSVLENFTILQPIMAPINAICMRAAACTHTARNAAQQLGEQCPEGRDEQGHSGDSAVHSVRF
ncbi:transcriptional enhancer factor TEF-3 isoform X4 [Alligator sinensis]|uniref:Transcriptional enhancer factor TEF-3 isoform X4 n=1 Tax=Alligator sinensis TaxID=38654 RepID=A0A3Q0FLL9_ALLSI|nr:transcriptional enhancer factor TEF-3 isoform X4 [Alligator sinensis]